MLQTFINNASDCYDHSRHFLTNLQNKPSRPRPRPRPGLSTPGWAWLLTWLGPGSRLDPTQAPGSARLDLQLLAPALDYSGFPPHDDIPCYFTATAVALAIAFQALQAIQAPKLSKLLQLASTRLHSARLLARPGPSSWTGSTRLGSQLPTTPDSFFMTTFLDTPQP